MKLVFSFAVVAFLVFPASAGVTVDHEAGIDFSSYRTYAWRPGTEAARPDVQGWVVKAVERELEARGMTKVSDGPADLYVVTHTSAEHDISATNNYVYLPTYDVGVLASHTNLTTYGTLIVDLLDGNSERAVWRGLASDVLGELTPSQVRKKVDKVTRKMFKNFPPR